jgi:hypothetical protein
LVSSTLIPEKLTMAGGYRYTKARKPGLYKDILGKEHHSELNVAWLNSGISKQK